MTANDLLSIAAAVWLADRSLSRTLAYLTTRRAATAKAEAAARADYLTQGEK